MGDIERYKRLTDMLTELTGATRHPFTREIPQSIREQIHAMHVEIRAARDDSKGAVDVIKRIATMPADPSLVTSNPEARMRALAKRWLADHPGGR
jgi:hypothetical protein